MAHSYPLHVGVLAQCFCCRSLQPFTFHSPTDQVVCRLCLHHLGSDKAERRDSDHVALWVGLFAEERANYQHFVAAAAEAATASDGARAKLAAQVAELTNTVAGQFVGAPSGEVRDILSSEIIARAERNTQLANRRTDRAMGALWRIGVMHRDDESTPGRCVCGRTTASCAEGLAIETERQELAAWERKNLDLLRAGERHGLPAEHPAVTAADGSRQVSSQRAGSRQDRQAAPRQARPEGSRPRPARSR